MACLIAAFRYFLIKCNLNGNTLLRVAGWEVEDSEKLYLEEGAKEMKCADIQKLDPISYFLSQKKKEQGGGDGVGNKMKGSQKNPDSLWTHHPWRYAKLIWTRPRGTWYSWTHVERRAELDDLQKSYQTQTIIWFCSSWAHSNETVELTSLPVLDCPGQTTKRGNNARGCSVLVALTINTFIS